jgi:hypothetical protein
MIAAVNTSGVSTPPLQLIGMLATQVNLTSTTGDRMHNGLMPNSLCHGSGEPMTYFQDLGTILSTYGREFKHVCSCMCVVSRDMSQ